MSRRKNTILVFGLTIMATLAGWSQTFGLKVWPTMHLVFWFPIVIISHVDDFNFWILLSCVQFPFLAICFAIGIRRFSPSKMAIAIGVFYVSLVCFAFVTAYPDLRLHRSEFFKHEKTYYSKIASSCDILLSRTNSTSDWWSLDGDDQSLPNGLLDLRAARIEVAKDQLMGTDTITAVIIVFGKKWPDFVVSWRQNGHGDNRPWELAIDSDNKQTVVFSRTNSRSVERINN